jgi:hypothetical protein
LSSPSIAHVTSSSVSSRGIRSFPYDFAGSRCFVRNFSIAL